MKIIQEGKAKIMVGEEKKISKKLEVFYNPVMKFNRDISVLLLQSIKENGLKIGSPLAGSGVRELRFLLELKKDKIESIALNDHKLGFIEYFKQNLKLNNIDNITSKKVLISNEDANLFLLKSKGFDYIDVDPFGTPNPFLDSAVRRISRRGILAVTATDTSALCGTYPDACARKYWAKPLRSELMQEIGLRILIRKVQLVGAQYDKALIPVFSYSKDHYMRVFFKTEKAKKAVDEVIKLHGFYQGAGPLWLGPLWGPKLVDSMLKNTNDPVIKKYLEIIKEEMQIPTIGFFDIHALCEKSKLPIPKREVLIQKLKKRGYTACRTIFNPYGIKTKASLKVLQGFLKEKA